MIVLLVVAVLGLFAASVHGAEAPPAAGTQAVALSPAAARALQSLPYTGVEPVLQWDWDPTAYETLAHPVTRDFGWRLKELAKSTLPDVARARLNLELAFLASSPDAPEGADPVPPESRMELARTGYGRLLSAAPGNGEYLTDLGDLYRLMGHADSALVVYRQAMTTERPPARLFGRLANSELERIATPADSAQRRRIDLIRRAGLEFFAGRVPADSLRAARHWFEAARFRMDMAVLDSFADRRLHPKTWETAGADSLFALLARVVAPETRRVAHQAADLDTSYAPAWGLVGSLITGQVLLPIAGRAVLARERVTSSDSLALRFVELIRERRRQKEAEMTLGGGFLARCEQLEPGRFPRVRMEQAHLALLFEDFDGAAGLWRALLARDPFRTEFAGELYTVYRLDTAIEGRLKPKPSPRPGIPARAVEPGPRAAQRLEQALLPLIDKPQPPGLLALLGWARTEQGRIDLAAVDFRHSARRDSLEWRARLNLAVVAIHDLKPAEAVDHLRVVGEQFPRLDDMARSRYCAAVGLLLWSRGDLSGARSWIAEARRFDPRNPVGRLLQ